MSLTYGKKFIAQTSAPNRPHILGFSVPRSVAADTLFEVWNAGTNAGLVAKLDKDGAWFVGAGSIGAPSLAFRAEATLGFYRKSPGLVGVAGALEASGAITAASFAGGGASLTGLDAANIATGSLADARLSANVALRNAANTFSAANQDFTSAAELIRLYSQVTVGSHAFGVPLYSTTTPSSRLAGIGYLLNDGALSRLSLGIGANWWTATTDGGIHIINGTGRVGVRTTTPATAFHVVGDSRIDGLLDMDADAAGRLVLPVGTDQWAT